jgi:hypothetical protein
MYTSKRRGRDRLTTDSQTETPEPSVACASEPETLSA